MSPIAWIVALWELLVGLFLLAVAGAIMLPFGLTFVVVMIGYRILEAAVLSLLSPRSKTGN